ncbi:MAG: C10 family peptidase [Bacteroidales bacterium]|nr:C10 family peptidase [Bacteroidales bacterium]
MKTLRLFLISLLCFSGMYVSLGSPVDTGAARTVACHFIRTRPGCSDIRPQDMKLAFTSAQLDGSRENGFYAFTFGEHGFVIVSADDRAMPILAYSTTSSLHRESMPAPAHILLKDYQTRIQEEASQPQQSRPEVAAQWEMLASDQPILVQKAAQSVEPLIKTTWNQSPYYNKYCPYDNEMHSIAVTGCTATAMAQIIRYWEWPKNGYGTCAYTHFKYGYLKADYGTANYNYSNMPVALDQYSSLTEVDAVARLMADCGTGVAMDYSPTGSGAWVLESVGKEYSAEHVLRKYYGYVLTEGTYKYLNGSTWLKRVKNDLDNGRPLLFCASKLKEGGHAFICDGYDDQGLFHFNWGWGGRHDGFYLMDSAYGFNIYQAAIFGLMPPTKLNSYHLVLFSDITASSDTISCGEAFTVRVNVENNGNLPFFGNFRMVLQNTQTEEIVAVFDTISCKNQALAGSSSFSSPLTFHGKLESLFTDNYNLRIQYIDTNADTWTNVAEIGNFSNKKSILFDGGVTTTALDTVTNITAHEAQVTGHLSKACSETVTRKAIQYKKSSAQSFTTVKDTSSGNTIRVELKNLESNTSYDVQTYVTVQADGTYKNYISDKRTFTTERADAIPALAEKGLRVYPNPAHGIIRIETTTGTGEVELRNTLGQKVAGQSLSGTLTELNVGQLSPGVYFVCLIQGEGKIIEKIVLE